MQQETRMTTTRPTGPSRPALALLVAAAATALLAGCGSSVKLDEAPVETRTARPNDAVAMESRGTAGTATAGAAAAAGATPAGTSPASSNTVTTVTTGQTDPGAAAGWPAQRVVYFDFDSYVVRPDAKPVIEGHARVLVAGKARRLVLEGHTDERGGREYNLALGQKRAEAVARSLVLLGVNESQLEAVSFGKERPAAEGSDEAAWEKNRRVELKEKR
jgi:peptidoglycan-associated lipoprotein